MDQNDYTQRMGCCRRDSDSTKRNSNRFCSVVVESTMSGNKNMEVDAETEGTTPQQLGQKRTTAPERVCQSVSDRSRLARCGSCWSGVTASLEIWESAFQ